MYCFELCVCGGGHIVAIIPTEATNQMKWEPSSRRCMLLLLDFEDDAAGGM